MVRVGVRVESQGYYFSVKTIYIYRKSVKVSHVIIECRVINNNSIICKRPLYARYPICYRRALGIGLQAECAREQRYLAYTKRPLK